MTSRLRAPFFALRATDFYERDVTLRLPFRFGAITLINATQLFVRARIELADGRVAFGRAAELLVPKWFDKDPTRSNDDNVADLRRAARMIADAYLDERRSNTAFGYFALHYRDHLARAAGLGLNPLVASFGPALVDRALLDALCVVHGMSFGAAIACNLPGITNALTPDLEGFDIDRFLAGLVPVRRIAARHTVGLLDPIAAPGARLGDGLPETLVDVVQDYGHRHFKLKVAGDVDADLERLAAIAAVIDRIGAPYVVTLDGNEQYRSLDGIIELWTRACATPALARLTASTAFIEQPLARAVALAQSVALLARDCPVLVDESDATLDVFPEARAQGYAGVSSKACKGVYKSLLNAARCAHWNSLEGGDRYFMSGEDLTCQAGVSVQQDLAIVAALGLSHVERNGHHYVNGMAGLPEAEQAAFLHAHPDLYQRRRGVVGLRIEQGMIALGSLERPGFGGRVDPAFESMRAV